ncbi:MAG: penicillin-binding protein [Kutzneria sp.]|nr:penicillin-binding protein [Kutzneria sp.]
MLPTSQAPGGQWPPYGPAGPQGGYPQSGPRQWPQAGPGREPVGDPTDLLPPVHEEYQREPELMTHREHDLPPGEHGADGYGGYDDPYEYPPDEEEARRLRKKRVWRRVRRIGYGVAAAGILGPVIAFVIAYVTLDPPDPQALMAQQNQTVTFCYSDGSPMATLGGADGTSGNRTIVHIDQIPLWVQNAVLAAEDETFRTNSGFDIKGILRAVWGQITGAGGGGSGITQQYVKKATQNEAPTLTRKFTELVKSVKMSQQHTKDQILEAYLNTVYFGRGAYGIKAAAKAYFGVDDLGKLTASQAAFLAGCINVPANNENVRWTTERWQYTMGRMAANNWLPADDPTSHDTDPPVPVKNTTGSASLPGPEQFILAQVEKEADNYANINEDRLRNIGAKVYTTIDKGAQKKAEDAVHKIMSADKQYPTLASALVSINPKNGEIVAWFGGDDPVAWSYDMASFPNSPGSSFKPLVFLAGMEKDPKIGLNSTYDGTDHQKFGEVTVNNADKESCGEHCTVLEAMTKSVNTVFYHMVIDIQSQSVRTAAVQAGIPDQIYNPVSDRAEKSLVDPGTESQTGGGIALGQYEVRPRDMAQAYSTLANDGMRTQSHFIRKIEGSDGTTWYSTQMKPELNPVQAFDQDDANHNQQLARNVTASMAQVAAHSCGGPNTHCASLDGNRPVAAKTGTAQFQNTADNANAWMVGYTPQIVTAVWVGNRDRPGPIHGNYFNQYGQSRGYPIYGREEPAYIWNAYMDTYLKGQPVEQFPPFKELGVPPTTTSEAPSSTTGTPSSTTTDDMDSTTIWPSRPPTTVNCFPGLTCETTTTRKPRPPGGGQGPGGGEGPGGGMEPPN